VTIDVYLASLVKVTVVNKILSHEEAVTVDPGLRVHPWENDAKEISVKLVVTTRQRSELSNPDRLLTSIDAVNYIMGVRDVADEVLCLSLGTLTLGTIPMDSLGSATELIGVVGVLEESPQPLQASRLSSMGALSGLIRCDSWAD
jgi:hypothetical protein